MRFKLFGSTFTVNAERVVARMVTNRLVVTRNKKLILLVGTSLFDGKRKVFLRGSKRRFSLGAIRTRQRRGVVA